MPRPPKFSSDQILDAAATLLAEVGPAALSVAAVARALGAPSGSIYHRFGSRDVLVATLWLRSVERFHAAITPTLDEADPAAAVRRFALAVVEWSRTKPVDARMLLVHRSSDLLHDGWPPDLVERNRAQRARVAAMLRELERRLGATDVESRRRVAFAAVDVPYAAVRSSLVRGRTPPPELDAIVVDAVDGVIGRLPMR